MRLRGIAGETLLTSRDPHDVAVARLIAGDTSAAIDTFRGASGKSNDADFWNDYAVACITRSDELDDPTLAIDAVSACDHALAIDTRNAAAHFNRGLALTRLGLLTSAADEWKRAAADDPSSPWAAEALQRAHNVPPNTLDGWTSALPHIAQLDAKQLDALVRAYPQQARTYGEGICMTEWADAILSGDSALADQRLTLARHIGDILRVFSGESLLHDSVLAADDTIRKGTSRTLAEAYTVYREGRIAHKQQSAGAAEIALRRADSLFSGTASPMALVSRYYEGSALFAQKRTAESETLLNALDAMAVDQRGYYGLSAQIGWERGLSLLARGSVTGAMEVFQRSRTLFDRIGERQLSSTMSSFVASSYDYVSAPMDAWRERRRALLGLSASDDAQRTAVTLTLAASQMARLRQWTRAQALYGLAIDAALRGGNPGTIAIAYSRRAMVTVQNGDAAAAADLNQARRWSHALTEPRMRAQAEAEIAFAEGIASARDQPHEAVDRFGEALSYYDRAGYRVELPRIYLERARAERGIGRVTEARADVAAGILVLESERERVRDLDLRETLFAGADELFAEGIDLALDAGERETAFAIAEAQRARALLDTFMLGGDAARRAATPPLPPAEIMEALSVGSAIIEYTALPDRVVAFVIRHDRIDVVALGSREKFADAVERLRYGADRADLAVASRAASAVLFDPLQRSLDKIGRIAFIRTPQIAGVPLSALYDTPNERFLLESVPLIEAPSATLAITASRHCRPLTSVQALVIGASRFDAVHYPEARPLLFAEREAMSVAAVHHKSMLLIGDAATRVAVLRELPRYPIVHFAGHGVGAMGRREAALLLASPDGTPAELRTSDFGRLGLGETQLVILAACHSGKGQGHNHAADDVALALLAAGVPSIVASRGDLNDDFALRVMPTFHRLITSGQTPAGALRTALLPELRDREGRLRPNSDWTFIHLLGGSADFINSTTERGLP